MPDSNPDSGYFSDDPQLRGMVRIGWLWLPAWNLVLLGVLIALGFVAKPAYRAYRAQCVEANLQAARTAARQGDWAAARDKAHSVLLARGQDLEACRIWTRALGKLGTADAYAAASELFANPRATCADMLENLQMMALQGPQAVALSAYASLPPALREQVVFRAAITPLLVQRGEIALAEANLREAAQASDPPGVRLELLRVLCCQPDAARVGEGRQILADLIATKAGPEALAGLLLLGAVPGGLAAGAPLPDLPAWLATQPQATALHHLYGMTPMLEAGPAQAQLCYRAAVVRFAASDPAALGCWLVGCGQAAMAASVLESAATTGAAAYLARLHALLALPNDPALAAALAAPPRSCDRVELELVQAAFESKRGERIAADAAWARALRGAAFDTSRNRCIDIARAAELSGAMDVAESAWVAALRVGWGPLPLYRDLLPVIASLVAKGRSEDLLVMFRCLLRLEPRNLDLQNNYYYFALLHGIMPPSQVATLLAKQVGQNEHSACNSTLMLAEILDGRAADALERLPRLRAGKEVSPMMQRALEGTARVVAGDTAAGSALLREVDWSSFMSQERIVFRSVLLQLKSGELRLPELMVGSADADPNQAPAWRKALQRHEQDHAGKVLPALPGPRPPGPEAYHR